MPMRPWTEDDHRAVQYLRVKGGARPASPGTATGPRRYVIVRLRADKKDALVSMLDAMEVDYRQI